MYNTGLHEIDITVSQDIMIGLQTEG